MAHECIFFCTTPMSSKACKCPPVTHLLFTGPSVFQKNPSFGFVGVALRRHLFREENYDFNSVSESGFSSSSLLFLKQQRIKKMQRLGSHLPQNPQHFMIKPDKLISVFPADNLFLDFQKYYLPKILSIRCLFFTFIFPENIFI